MKHAILGALASSPGFLQLKGALPPPGKELTVGGAVGSLATAIVAALHETAAERTFVVVVADPAQALAAEADLETLLGRDASHLFPQREALPYEALEQPSEIGGLRVEAVEALFRGRSRLIVTTPRALQERTPIPYRLAELRITLEVGDSPGFGELLRLLEDRGFERASIVEEVGQFTVRGGILDLFSLGSSDPVRLEFRDDEIVSLRVFDILDQRSMREEKVVHILPAAFRRQRSEGKGGGPGEGTALRSLLDLLPRATLLSPLGEGGWRNDLKRRWANAERDYAELARRGENPHPPRDLLLAPKTMLESLAAFPALFLRPGSAGDVVMEAREPPHVDRDMDRLRALLIEGAARGDEALILCDNDGQIQRLEEILGGRRTFPPRTRLAVGSLERGFLLGESSPPMTVLTDHEIFRRSRRLRMTRRFRRSVALERITQLMPGEYIVHFDHGIGRFRGLERIRVAGEEIEALAIEYADGEILRVPVHRLDLVERWTGGSEDAEPPSVHRLGGRKWKTLRRKTRHAIERMTAELLHLYARREAKEGFAYAPDTRWQREMESSFLYEDTPDQRGTLEDVKRDMESSRPMDRLLCGDVGYGKTEVAIRAAFKAVQDGKQVAVLAPTTILVEQHGRTFGERLADYPVHVGTLNRFRTPKEGREILAQLAGGGVDIIIGTHRLLSKDVRFKDLGLLIVDEEQRFGVRHKERLKELRVSIDVLTLTATPIPRTLFLSLSGIRDLSLIRTPPRDRMPIVTHVLPWSDHILSGAIERELDRKGQLFFLHNRIETIHSAAERVRALAPDAEIAVAHGRMPGTKLDGVMRGFVEGRVDILVSSSIIENGLDVPNANTLIVDRADNFGLAQLYQIRGRVGRSDRRAYCYLTVPEDVSEQAEKRLRVLAHYTELGSGYSVSLRDLELRGAGNVLGADQSGFARAVGLDTYFRLMKQTVRQILGEDGDAEHPEPEVSIGAAALLPEDYISDSGEKLHLYRRLTKVKHRVEVRELKDELIDRFGPLPDSASRLLEAALLRIQGRKLGIERILIRDREARINFREGVTPRMSGLRAPLQRERIEVEVRRVSPLSLRLRQRGVEPVSQLLIRALDALANEPAEAA